MTPHLLEESMEIYGSLMKESGKIRTCKPVGSWEQYDSDRSGPQLKQN